GGSAAGGARSPWRRPPVSKEAAGGTAVLERDGPHDREDAFPRRHVSSVPSACPCRCGDVASYQQHACVMTPRGCTRPPLLHGQVASAAVAEDLGKVCLGDVGGQGVEDAACGELHRVLVAIDARR